MLAILALFVLIILFLFMICAVVLSSLINDDENLEFFIGNKKVINHKKKK